MNLNEELILMLTYLHPCAFQANVIHRRLNEIYGFLCLLLLRISVYHKASKRGGNVVAALETTNSMIV